MVQRKTALVTGGSRGIGAAICRALARDGFAVAVNYTSSKEKAEKIASEINGFAVQADVGDEQQVATMFESLKEKFGTLDVLVNNAGVVFLDGVDDVQQQPFMETQRVNLWGTMNCIRQARGLMKQGAIVNISSICAVRRTPDALAYAASKAGVNALTVSLAGELAPKIRINAVSPSATETDMAMKNYGGKKELKEWAERNFPLQRLGQPEDIAETVAFLCSDKACHITGQIWTIDGGLSVK